MGKENFNEIKFKVEAILFSYGDWITVNEIMKAASIDSKKITNNVLEELEKQYQEGYSFIVEKGEDEKWKMALRKEYDDLVAKLVSGQEIPHQAIKVLSVIAYEQPVTKTRLNEILGRSVKQELEYLYKEKFITYKKKGIGKYYRVTKKFNDYFEIDNDEEFREIVNEEITEEEK